MQDGHRCDIRATFAGFGAILLWSTTMGLSRVSSESLGVLTSGGIIALTAGVIGSGLFYRRRGVLSGMVRDNKKYLFGCGSLFVVYLVFIYSAVGFAANRLQVLEVSVINYLWPSLTQIISLAVFHYRAKRWLILAMTAAFGGVVLAMTPDGGYSLHNIAENFRSHYWPYIFAFAAAIGWAVYSNLARLWTNGEKVRGVPLFFIVSGILMLILSRFTGEQSIWSIKIVALVITLAAGPALTAYHLWDIAMQRGNMAVVVSVSYLTPVLSMIVSCLVFQTLGRWTLWGGCVLVVLGAIVCANSIYHKNDGDPGA